MNKDRWIIFEVGEKRIKLCIIGVFKEVKRINRKVRVLKYNRMKYF